MGWTLVAQGQARQGLEQIRQGLAALEPMGIQAFKPWWFVALAEAYGTVGQAAAGLNAVMAGLAVTETTEERWYAADTIRLRSSAAPWSPLSPALQ